MIKRLCFKEFMILMLDFVKLFIDDAQYLGDLNKVYFGLN